MLGRCSVCCRSVRALVLHHVCVERKFTPSPDSDLYILNNNIFFFFFFYLHSFPLSDFTWGSFRLLDNTKEGCFTAQHKLTC